MQRIIEQYFDFGVMFDPDNFDKVLAGFWFTIKLSIVAGIIALIWGLILAVLRQTPGQVGARHSLADDRLYRHLPRRPGAAHHPARGRQPRRALRRLPGTGDPGVLPRWIGVPDWFGQPSPFWYGVFALVLTYGAYLAEVYRAGIEAVPGRPDGGRSLARHEPRPGDAQGDRPAGHPQGDSASAQRLHRADEGHDPGQRDRFDRGRAGRPRHPVGDVQQLVADAGSDPFRPRHDPAGSDRRRAHLQTAGDASSGGWHEPRRGGE